jgi:Uma2 family endonuclease
MGTTTLMSLAEFERLDGPEHVELLKGELISMPPAERRHSQTARKLLLLLSAAIQKFRSEGRGEAVPDAEIELGYLLDSDPPTWLQPDVSVPHAGQPGDRYFEGAPMIAVEVISPSDTASRTENKVLTYLAHGAAEVWVIYPELRHARLFYPDGSAITETKALHSRLLPGVEIPLADIL